MTLSRRLAIAVLLTGVFIALLLFDRPIAEYFHARIGDYHTPRAITTILRLPGDYTFALACAIALLILRPKPLRDIWLLVLAGLPGAINAAIKGIAGRARPFTMDGGWQFLRGGWYGFWHQKNLSFMSGDAVEAFAWAEALSIIFPGARACFYAWAVITGMQRVVMTAHWASDAFAGAVLGVVTVRVVFRILWAVAPQATESAVAQNGPERHDFPRAELADMTDPNAPYLSLVIPCYNEEENVPTLLARVEASLNTLEQPYEVILIDDGSTDSTPALLAKAQTVHPWLRVLRMHKNSGQSAGFEAGFNAARGKFIGTIDADLQNDPEEVPRLVKMLEASPDYDMVTGWRKDRQDTNFRRWQSRQANKIRNWISQDDINDSASSLKVYRAATIQGLKLFNGAHRFFPALVKMRGYKVLETPVKHSARFAGTAKYGFRNRAFRAFIDLLGVRWMKMRYLRYGVDEAGRDAAGQASTQNAV